MTPTDNPVLPAEGAFALALVMAGAGYMFIRWLRSGGRKPDPWEVAPVEQSPADETESPICLHCLTPHADTAHFCPRCGYAVGAYNNYLPFECLFSEGEALRSGTSGAVRMTPLTTTGYVLLSLATFYFLAPIYWVAMFLKIGRGTKADTATAQAPPEHS